MTPPLLDVRSLAIDFPTDDGLLHALRGVSLRVERGEILGIVGESGCGKTTLAYAMLGDPGAGAIVRGEALLSGQDVLRLPAPMLRSIQGRRVAMVPQNPGASLNPARRVGDQLREVLDVHGNVTGPQADAQIAALLDKVHLPHPAGLLRRWPHELSGGQQQRIVIAMALLGRPDLLVLDEPTTGLDVTVEAAVLDLLAALRDDLGVTVVIISHNLGAIARSCDRVVVMYAGLIVESGSAATLFAIPRHPYTRALLACVPRADLPQARQPPRPIPGSLPDPRAPLEACAFADRCAHARPACRAARPPLVETEVESRTACLRWRDIPPDVRSTRDADAGRPGGGDRDLLRVETMRVSYPVGRRNGRPLVLHAVDDVSLAVGAGQVTAIVGESGSGKSSLAMAIAGLRPADAGVIRLGGKPVARSLRRRPGWTRRFLQMVFQDHSSTLNPALRSGDAIARAVRLLDDQRDATARARTAELIAAVGLDTSAARRRPKDLSGGQRQRVAIARAFAGRPNLVVCDEITSALDVSVQAQVLAFLRGLQRAYGTSLLFITHDLGVVRQIADEVVVMYLGAICERGPAEAVFAGPNHPYTAALLSAVPVPDPAVRRGRIRLEGPLPDPMDRRIGCPLKTRCPRKVGPVCDDVEPPWRALDAGHEIRCHIEADALAEGPPAAAPPIRPTIETHRPSDVGRA